MLLSAHLGGRDIVPLASQVGLLGGDRIREVEATARAMVAQGRGAELMLLPGWWHVVTAQSYLDYGAELPDVLALAESVSPVRQDRGAMLPAPSG